MKSQYWFGKWKPAKPLTAQEAARLCRQAALRRRRVAEVPLDKVLRLLGRVRERWRSSAYPPRLKVERLLPQATGFSPAMIRKGLEELCWTLDPQFLQRKIDTELRGIDGTGDYRWEPLGIVLHVLAGNVFVGTAGSLVEGLITGNVNILKMPSSETVFLPELIRSLRENDEEGLLSRALAVVEYSSAQRDVIAEFKNKVDAIVVWGGEEAVKAYRNDLPARTRLIVFGPKLSLAVITKEGLKRQPLASAAATLAAEMSLWDQNACTAPQLCLVEGLAQARSLCETLPAALEKAALALPPGRVERDNAVEIRKLRSVFEVAEARGEGLLRESTRGLDWTVVLDIDQTLEPSPLHRTLRVIPIASLEQIAPQLEALRGYIQTVGLAAGDLERAALSERLCALGALRVVELGAMAEGEIDDPHDGRYDLPQFKQLVLSRFPAPAPGPLASLSPERRLRLIDERLRRLIDAARRSRFYGRRLKGLKIETVMDLPRIPQLTREEMDAHMPPKGEGLSTGPWRGGYVSRSGGSTGEPKFSIYDRHDWQRLIEHATPIWRALGLEETDRLGNFMLAGDLYGSFISFDHINHGLGLTSFAFAGTSKPEAFVDVWRKFRLNAVQGIPSHLIPFLRAAKRLEPSLALQKLVYAGAPLSPSDYDWLKAELKVERIASVIGANDGGQIAYQCPRMRGALHHTLDDFNYLEIVDDKGRPVPDGRPGRILITSLLKYAFPLIRYALGDQGRILPGPCPCGSGARVLEYLGRADDIISVGLLNVRYRDFADALRDLPISTLQLAARNDASGESVVVRIETDGPTDQVKPRVHAALFRSMDKLKQRLEDGSLSQLRVEFFKPGELPRHPRSGKVRALVDERA